MRARWTILGGTGVIGTVVAVMVIVGHSRDAKSDTAGATSSSSSRTARPPHVHDPFTLYPLGPHAIEYDQLSAGDKAGVDLIEETVETTQPASSYQAWAAATAYTGQQAEAEIAARGVGLTGTDSDGVVR